MKTKNQNITILNNSKKVIKTVLGIFMLSLFLLTSCKSDETEDKEDPKADGAALATRFADNRKGNVQHFTLDISTGGTIVGSQGSQLVIPANAFELNGAVVTGNVDIEFVEIYDKASMVLNNMPTSGKRSNGDEEALKSKGEFFINAKQNGAQLDIATPITLESATLEGENFSTVESMQGFKAGDDLQDTDVWEEIQGPAGRVDAAVGERLVDGEWVIYYLLIVSDFGWTNLDRWYSFTGPKTNIFIDTPADYDDTNCEVYLTYDGEPTALARMDIYDSSVGMFTEHYGQIPIGQEIHIIMVAEIDGVLHSTIQGTTVVDGHIEVMAAPTATTQAALTAAINALP